MLSGLHERRMHEPLKVLTESRRKAEGFAVAREPAVLARVPLSPAERGSAEDKSRVGHAVLVEALFLASRQGGTPAGPAAGDGLDAQPIPSPGNLTRRAYELRSRWRPTPHGAFAGVAVARVTGPAERACLRLGSSHRPRTGPSGRWLAELEAKLLTDTALLNQLRLTASNLVVQRGERLEHRWQGRRSTIRATQASLLVMRLCADGMTGAEVVVALVRRWPASGEAARNVVAEMARGGFVSTDLLPADVTCDPLGHLLGKLPPGHRLDPSLRRLRGLLAAADERAIGDAGRLATLTGARDLADEICLVSRPLSLDVAADADIAIPASLLDEAARSAAVLERAVARPAALADWHERFVERYGPNRPVPLLEATDAAAGLGIATEDIEDTAGTGALDDNRERVMPTLVAAAIADGRREVFLDRNVLAQLADGRDSPPPGSAEIAVRVIASSQLDLAAGRLMLAVVPPGPQEAGSTIGRFASLLPGAWPGPPAAAPGALVAEIAVQAGVPEGAGLAPPAGFAAIRIPVGVPGRPVDLNLADLHLFSDGRRLFCWSVLLGREIVPVLYSRLAPALLPPVARFLQLLGRAAGPMLSGWSWGPLASGPFQPRVRHGRVILAPARWLLPESLTSAASDPSRWGAALDEWRAAATPRPPQVVVTDRGDHRLPLDLTRADDRELLRRYVRRGLTAVCEQPGGPSAVQAVAEGPGGRHVLELVIPLKPAAAPAPAPHRPYLTPRAFDEGLFLPGGPWLSIHVSAPRTCQDQILGQLETLCGDLAGQFELCFWLRYADPAHGHHLRIRFRGDPAALGGAVLPALSQWCAGLRQQRLAGAFSVEPYDQEIERYGGPDAITAAERVFAADSHLVCALLAPNADPSGRLVSAAVSIAAITTAVSDGIRDALSGHHLSRDARRRYEQSRPAARLAAPSADLAAFPSEAMPGAATSAWQARHETLTAYRAQLKPDRRAPCAAALSHMHANRLLGDTVAERIAIALAVDLLARRAAEPPS
jgi:lantibiotic biosynthesis protein